MQYQGGKFRIAKEITGVIVNEISRRKIQDQFSYIKDNRKYDGGG